MRIGISAAIALTCASILAPAAMATDYDVYLLAGQSNMDGRGAASDLTGGLSQYATPDNNVKLFYDNPVDHSSYTPTGWVSLQPGYSVDSSKSAPLPSITFGPELGFGVAMQAAEPAGHTVALIKVSQGGVNLRSDWNPSKSGGLFDLLISDTKAEMASLATSGNTVTLKGMIWHQGESDVSSTQSAYQTELTGFINSVRSSLSAPSLPFVIGEVNDNGSRDNIIAAQEAVSSIPGYDTGFASSAGLTTWDNGTHFDANSQIILGQRFAASIQSLEVPEPTGLAWLVGVITLNKRWGKRKIMKQ